MYLTLILDAANAGGGTSMIMMILIMGVFFAFMVLPQMRKQKKAKAFNSQLQKGNHIVTASGIHGKIVQNNETNFVIELEDGARMKIELAAISMDMTMANYASEHNAK